MNARKLPLSKKNPVFRSQENSPMGTTEAFKEPDHWTIITALDRILSAAEDSHLSDEFWESVKNPLTFLNKELGLTNMQIVVLAIMIEAGEAVSWKRLGNYLGCSRLSMMVYTEEIEELVDKRWAIRRTIHEFGDSYVGFALVHGVVTALRHNKTFVPEKIDGLNEQQFVDKLENHIEKNMNDRHIEFEDDEEWMLQLVKANPHLPLCHEILRFDDIHVQSLLLLIVADYGQWEGTEGEGLTYETINRIYPEDFECDGLRYRLRSGTHALMEHGFIEHKCVEGQANIEQYMLNCSQLIRPVIQSAVTCVKTTVDL